MAGVVPRPRGLGAQRARGDVQGELVCSPRAAFQRKVWEASGGNPKGPGRGAGAPEGPPRQGRCREQGRSRAASGAVQGRLDWGGRGQGGGWGEALGRPGRRGQQSVWDRRAGWALTDRHAGVYEEAVRTVPGSGLRPSRWRGCSRYGPQGRSGEGRGSVQGDPALRAGRGEC